MNSLQKNVIDVVCIPSDDISICNSSDLEMSHGEIVEVSHGEIVDESVIVPRFVINNCVATAFVGCLIPLEKIIMELRASKYNTKVFAALEIKLHDPACTALIFSSGRFVISGCRSFETSRLAMLYFIEILASIDIHITIQPEHYKIQNIVSSTWVQRKISLPKIYALFQKESNYNPQLFPGLTYRPEGTNMVLLLFTSGKCVLTGAKNASDLDNGYIILTEILKEYDLNSSVDQTKWEKMFKINS